MDQQTSFDIIYSSRVGEEHGKSLQGLPFFDNVELVEIEAELPEKAQWLTLNVKCYYQSLIWENHVSIELIQQLRE